MIIVHPQTWIPSNQIPFLMKISREHVGFTSIGISGAVRKQLNSPTKLPIPTKSELLSENIVNYKMKEISSLNDFVDKINIEKYY
jgi:hypothetical protein